MKKMRTFMLTMFTLAISPLAMAAVSNVTGKGEGATREAAVAKAKDNLNQSCKSFGGKALPDSFKVTFEKPLSNGQHYVDATMQCDIP